jgi:hypothetical protein
MVERCCGARAAGASWQLEAQAARVRLRAGAAGEPPAPVVAHVALTLERSVEGAPLRLRGAVAVHGVTTWFTVDLASGTVALRDARGGSWSGRLEAAPEPVRQLVTTVREQAPREPTRYWTELRVGGVRLDRAASASEREETRELTVRVEDPRLLERIRATRVALEWQALALRVLAGRAG